MLDDCIIYNNIIECCIRRLLHIILLLNVVLDDCFMYILLNVVLDDCIIYNNINKCCVSQSLYI